MPRTAHNSLCSPSLRVLHFPVLIWLIFLTAFVVEHPVRAADSGSTAKTYVAPFGDIVWTPLNPARGKLGPKAATLWGDRTAIGKTGFLVAFRKGFSSPPHIHNVSYRGIVIAGLIHNDEPDAEDMWLTPESYWTQPAGHVHITSAHAETNVAYIEIDQGPYLVRPTSDAFDNGETSLNLDKSNLVWMDSADLDWTGQPGQNTQLSFLWGRPNSHTPFGSLLRLPPGFEGTLRSGASEFRAVTILGQTGVTTPDTKAKHTLEPGSYFGSDRAAPFTVNCEGPSICTLYLSTAGTFTLNAAKTPRDQ